MRRDELTDIYAADRSLDPAISRARMAISHTFVALGQFVAMSGAARTKLSELLQWIRNMSALLRLSPVARGR
jgi:hypothetical protein